MSKSLRPVIALAACLLLTAGTALIAVQPATAAGDDGGDSLTLTGPAATGVSVTVTPKDLSTVRQGDTVSLHFSGLKNAGDSVLVGTCPSDLDLSKLDFDTYGSVATQQACLAKLPTGLSSDVDPTSPNNPGLSTAVYAANPRPDGTVDVNYLVGSGQSVGTTAYTLFNKGGDIQNVSSLVCDSTHACVIGFEVTRAKKPYAWRDLTDLKISPAENDSTGSGCKGLSDSVTVTAYGPERMQDPLAAMNSGYCSTTSSPVPVSYVPAATGENDPLGVSAVGNGTDLAVAGSPLLARHPLAKNQVAVPIAINSVELAQWGGASQSSISPAQLAYNKVPVAGLAVTPGDIAGIVLHKYPLTFPATLPTTQAAADKQNPLAAQLRTRPGNAAAIKAFDVSSIGLPLYTAPTVTYSVGSDSTAIALSSYLDKENPDAWAYPSNDINSGQGRSGKAVGKIEGFSEIVDHTDNGSKLTSQVSTTGGLYNAKFAKDNTSGTTTYLCPDSSLAGPTWQKALTKACLRFGVMDSATAATLGFTGTQVASGDGYVAPTTPSLSAAAAGTLNADGYFDTSSASAYPMTYVEYAVVSTSPLLDSKCKARGQEDTLKKFLTYAVGDGQSTLPAGLAPLNDSLKTQALSAIAKIGTGTPSGSCGSTPNPVSTSGGNSGGSTGFTGSGGTGGAGGTAAATPVASISAEPTTTLGNTQAVVQTVPPFGNAKAVSPAKVVIGLLLLAILITAAAFCAANRIGARDLATLIRQRAAELTGRRA